MENTVYQWKWMNSGLHATRKQPDLRHFKLDQRSQLQKDSACLLPYKHFAMRKAFFLVYFYLQKVKNQEMVVLEDS